MITKIQKWGNSQGIRFPVEVLKQIRVSVGDEVNVEVHGHEITVKPISRTRGKYRLRDVLLKKAPKANELDWSSPSGKEVW